MRPGSTTCSPASNALTSGVVGLLPAGTSSAIRPPWTTMPRSAPSAKIASGSLIHSAGASPGMCQPGGADRRRTDAAGAVDLARDIQDQRLLETRRHDLHADRQLRPRQ